MKCTVCCGLGYLPITESCFDSGHKECPHCHGTGEIQEGDVWKWENDNGHIGYWEHVEDRVKCLEEAGIKYSWRPLYRLERVK